MNAKNKVINIFIKIFTVFIMTLFISTCISNKGYALEITVMKTKNTIDAMNMNLTKPIIIDVEINKAATDVIKSKTATATGTNGSLYDVKVIEAASRSANYIAYRVEVRPKDSRTTYGKTEIEFKIDYVEGSNSNATKTQLLEINPVWTPDGINISSDTSEYKAALEFFRKGGVVTSGPTLIVTPSGASPLTINRFKPIDYRVTVDNAGIRTPEIRVIPDDPDNFSIVTTATNSATVYGGGGSGGISAYQTFSFIQKGPGEAKNYSPAPRWSQGDFKLDGGFTIMVLYNPNASSTYAIGTHIEPSLTWTPDGMMNHESELHPYEINAIAKYAEMQDPEGYKLALNDLVEPTVTLDVPVDIKISTTTEGRFKVHVDLNGNEYHSSKLEISSAYYECRQVTDSNATQVLDEFYIKGVDDSRFPNYPSFTNYYNLWYKVKGTDYINKVRIPIEFKVGPADDVEANLAALAELEAANKYAGTLYGDPEQLVGYALNPRMGLGLVVHNFTKLISIILTFIAIIMVGVNIILARHKADERTSAMTGFTYITIGIIILDVAVILYDMISSAVGDLESQVETAGLFIETFKYYL